MADNTYGFADPGIVAPERFPQMQNPYGIPAQPSQQQQPQAGLLDSHPYHEYLKTYADEIGKKPWELTDEDITKNGLESYMGDKGPVKAILGHDEAIHNRRGSGTTIDDHVKNELNYHKLMAQKDVEQNLPHIKAYLQSLKQQNSTTTPEEYQPSSFTTGLKRSILHEGSGLAPGIAKIQELMQEHPDLGNAIASTGALPFAAAKLLKAMGYGPEQLKQIGEAAAQKEATLPEPKGVSQTLGQIAGGFVPSLLDLGTGSSIRKGIDVKKAGGSDFDAATEAAINAGENLAMMGVGGVAAKPFVNPLTRRLVGGLATGGLGAGIEAAETGKVDPTATAVNFTMGALGAGNKGEVNVKPKEGEPTPSAKPTQAPVQEGKPTDTSGTAGAAPTKLSEQSQGILDDALTTIYRTPDPVAAKALHDELIASVPAPERPAFSEAFNADWSSKHGGSLDLAPKPEETPAATPEETALAEQVAPTEKEKALAELDKFQRQAPGAAIVADSPAGREFTRLLKNARDAGATEDEINAVGKESPAVAPQPPKDALQARTDEQLKLVNEYPKANPIRKGVITRKLSKELGIPVADVKGFIEHINTVNAAKATAAKPKARLNPLTGKVEPISPKAKPR